MIAQKISLAAMWSGIVAGIFCVLLACGSVRAEDYQHHGEEMNNQALLGVTNVAGRWQLNWGRRKPDLLAPVFTMSYCGREVEPTIDNLLTMIGKPCRGWAGSEGRWVMAYHRLEFQCQ